MDQKTEIIATDAVRLEFDRDEISVKKGIIQIYWLRDKQGIWVSAPGGPITGGTAKRRVYAFAKLVQDSRDRLPVNLRSLPIHAGEMSGDGTFESLAVYSAPEKEE